MLNVAIVDDEAQERSRIRSCLKFISEEKKVEFAVDEYETAEAFLMAYDCSYDLIFMDVLFGNGHEDGMQAARKLRKVDKTVALVFITNMLQMALHGYEVDALDFILKPVERSAFAMKMERVLGRIGLQGNAQVALNTPEGTVRLRTNLIRYLLIRGHYVEYHSREGVYKEYSTLAAAEKKLGDPAFVRCDRSYLVNLRYVSRIEKNACIVDGEELPLARTQKAVFAQAFSEFLSGRG